MRKYRLAGGRVRRVRIRYPRPKEVLVEFRVSAREATRAPGIDSQKLQLRIRLEGVEEFRFQMRPNLPKSHIGDARIAYLNGLFYVSFDSLGLDPGEMAQVFDFRASEAYAASRELFWEEVAPKAGPGTPTMPQ